MLLTGRALGALSEAHLYTCSSFFGLDFFHRLGSMAKRDQSFICAYPALRKAFTED